MSEMIERVKDAFITAYFCPVRQSEEWADDVARAVISAMREPTEAMIAAGMKEAAVDLRSEYCAMVDEALTAKPTNPEPTASAA